jgi:hypothetical protein
MNTHGELIQPEASYQRSWYSLFFGCFGRDAGSKKWSKRGAYAVVFPALGTAARFGLEGYLPETVLNYILAASVGAAIGFIYWTTWRYMQDLDELHQRIMLEAVAFSFFITMPLVVIAGIVGMTEDVVLDVTWIYVVAEVMRGVGLMIAGRKYR